MDNRFKREKLELAYKAHIFDVYNDYLTLPDGGKVVYDYIDHVPGCCIVPVDDQGNIILVTQYRNAVDDITYEVPAGSMNQGEDPVDCARRELEEETGYVANDITYVTKTYLLISTSNEYTYVYIGRNLTPGKQNFDPEEFINVHKFSRDEVVEMLKKGTITDSKSIIAIQAYLSGMYE